MSQEELLRMSAEYQGKVIESLLNKRIVDVRLPSRDEPFDEIVLILDDGNRVMLAASSADGSGIIAWGLNVPGDDR